MATTSTLLLSWGTIGRTWLSGLCTRREDRVAAEREVIDNLVKQLVSAYSSEYFGDDYAGFEAYIWDMIGGNVLLTN